VGDSTLVLKTLSDSQARYYMNDNPFTPPEIYDYYQKVLLFFQKASGGCVWRETGLRSLA
jgi:hypothetical protein